MNIGLIDVDSHNFPNLCLMKISAYHKGRGDNVEWWNGLKHYDVVYKSKVFDETYSQDMEYCINADEVICGGTGYDLKNKLPEEIEHQYPDYELYGGGYFKSIWIPYKRMPKTLPILHSQREGRQHTYCCRPVRVLERTEGNNADGFQHNSLKGLRKAF